jgi:uncharacterized SAM-binding protein YcdF (DUF218 family)
MGTAAPRRLRDFVVRRREVWTLTWPARLLVLALLLGGGLLLARHAGSFLAVSDPPQGEYLVVEAWMPDYTYQAAAQLWSTGRYRRVIAVRVVSDDAASGSGATEYAAVGSLVRAGIPRESIVEATDAGIHVDRTFHSAMNVRHWLETGNITAASVDVLTLGPHARRSRLLFRKALGEGFEVGVIAVADRRFDAAHWWRTSEGVRSVLGEFIAYLYARVFFDANNPG